MILFVVEATVCEHPRNLPHNVAVLHADDTDATFQVAARSPQHAAKLVADLNETVLEQTIAVCRAARLGEYVFYGYDFNNDEVIEIGEDF